MSLNKNKSSKRKSDKRRTRKNEEKKRSTYKRRKTMTGGLGASDYAKYVFGDVGQQHPVNSISNEIKMNDPTKYNVQPVATQPIVSKGGRRNKKGGKNIITDISVPAVLLLGNSIFKPEKKNDNKTHENIKVRFSKSKDN